MEQYEIFDSIGKVMNLSNIGVWAMELDKGKPPRFYADSIMKKTLMIYDISDPCEFYEAWHSRIVEEQVDLVADGINRMIEGQNIELQYSWNHPSGKIVEIRLSGTKNDSYTNGIRLEGYQQDVTGVHSIRYNVGVDMEEVERTRAFSELFMGTYTLAYYVNVTDSTRIICHTNDFFDYKYDIYTNYYDGLSKYIDTDVDPEDRETAKMMIQPFYIKMRLMESAEYSVVIRDISEGEAVYYSLQVQRGLDSDHAVVGLLNINHEMHIKQEQETKNRVLEALASNYDEVEYVVVNSDSALDKSISYRSNPIFKSLIPNWDSMQTFSERLIAIGRYFCFEDDREYFMKAIHRELVFSELEKNSAYYITFRAVIGDEIQYYQMKFIGERKTEDGPIDAMIVGWRSIDSEVRMKKAQEEALTKQTRAYKMLHDIIRSGMWVVNYDAEGKMLGVTWSEEFRKMLGYQSEEEFPNTFDAVTEILHPEDRGFIFPEMHRTVSDVTGKYIFDVRARLKTKNRDYRWFRATGSVMRDENGMPMQFFGIFVDINDAEELEQMTLERIKTLEEQVMLQNQLDKEKEHVKMLHDIIHSAMWQMELGKNETIRSVTWSEEFRKMLGYQTESEFPNELDTIKSCIHPEEYERVAKHFRDTIAEGSEVTEYDAEFRMFLKNNDVNWFHASGRIVRDPMSRTGSFYGTLVNTTDAHNSAQMQSVLSAMAGEFACVCYIDTKNDEDIVYHCEDYVKQYLPGFDQIKNFGDRLRLIETRFVAPEERDEFIKAVSLKTVRANLENKDIYLYNCRFIMNRHEEYWQIKFSYGGSDSSHIVAGFRNVDAELKSEKEYQKQLMDARSKAEEANAAKSVFLFNMSHDIRTPMNAIIGFCGMAQKYIQDTEKVQDCLEKVSVASNHLLQLINDVLDMARIENGKIEIEETEADISQCVDDLVNIVKAGADVNQLNFTVVKENLQNRIVYADVLHVNRIFLNILSNAIKYTKAGGSVTWTIREVEAQRKNYGAYDFTVEDTGIGMSEEFVEHVFDAFARAESSTVSGKEGTGLGMAIAKQLCDRMGGTITVQSELGVGTKVMIHLEFRPVESTLKSDDTLPGIVEAKIKLAGRRVLLVEDNELNREIAVDILEDEGLLVDQADDGSVAVEMVKKEGPDYYDIVLMDIQMPYMDGYKATQAIRSLQNADYSHLPIIAMTANAFEEDKKQALAAGMNAHLPKPVKSADLMEILNTFIKMQD